MSAALDIYVESRTNFRRSRTYELQAALPRLRQAGVHVRILDQPLDRDRADASLFHIDLTEIPEVFRGLGDQYKRTINGSAYSIHRSLYSTLRLLPGEAHDGPVIVKTVLNSHGRPELRYRQHRSIWTRTGHQLRKIIEPRFKQRLAPSYQVYASPRAVPAAVWRDDQLMVEKFALPTLRLPIVKHRYLFLGDAELVLKQAFDDILCSGAKLLSCETEERPVPRAVMEVRERLRIDFGSIDYFVVDGTALVVDANKTYTANPAWSRRFAFRQAFSDQIAEKLVEFARG